MTQNRLLHAIPCSSKDLLFLKSDSGTDDTAYTPPETYVSDLILDSTAWMDAFVSKLNKAHIPDNRFHLAVLRITAVKEDTSLSHTESSLADLTRNNAGIWGRITDQVFTLALWNLDPDQEKNRFGLLKKRLASTLHAQISMGVARFPHLDYSRKDTFHNAIKALDHAAFFGRDSLAVFDDVSLNISGDRLYELGRVRDAALEYTRGLVINPKSLNLRNSLGVCYGVMNRLDKAMEEFDKAMAIDGADVMVIYNAGLAANLSGDPDLAVDLLQKASRLNSGIFEVELTAGSLLLKTDQVEQAMIHLDRASRLNPSSSAPMRVLGDHYLAVSKPDAAIPEYNKAIRLNPSDAQALSNLARAFDMLDKNLDIAVTFAREAVTLVPENPEFRKVLGSLYLKKGQRDLAESEFKSAGIRDQVPADPDETPIQHSGSSS